jgi:transposase
MRDSPWACDLLTHVESMFTVWHAFRDGATTRAGLQTAMQPIQAAIRTALEDGRTRTWDNVTAVSQEVLTRWDALWTVVTHPGVAPTNNAAERVLRPAVIWRKQCFGAQSADGSRFVERILSVVTTCRQQGGNVWNLLTDAVRAAMTGQPAPTLLPTP